MTMPSLPAELAVPGKGASQPDISLVGLSRAEIGARLTALGVPERQVRMRVRQLWSWIYVRGATDFDAMTDVAKELRAELARSLHACAAGDRRPSRSRSTARANGCFAPPRGRTARRSRPSISPRKTAARCASRARSAARSPARSAIPARSGWCATSPPRRSSARSCSPATGIGDWPGATAPKDPRGSARLGAQDHQCRADGHGRAALQFRQCARRLRDRRRRRRPRHRRKRRITLSTSGVVPEIPRWGEEAGTMLAISLHAVRDELRDQARADQQEIADRASCSRPAATIPASPTPGASPSNM